MKQVLFYFKWCGRLDLNQHTLRHTPLKRTCLPIPPRPHPMIQGTQDAVPGLRSKGEVELTSQNSIRKPKKNALPEKVRFLSLPLLPRHSATR